MHHALHRAVAIAIVSSTFVGTAVAQTPSFDELIQGVLQRHKSETAPAQPAFPLGSATPTPGATPGPAPQPPAAVELGPRPYTPPKITPSEPTSAPAAATNAPAEVPPAEGGTAPAVGVAPLPGAEATSAAVPEVQDDTAAPSPERTRESLTVEEVNAAVFPAELGPIKGASPLILKAQVLLDRAGASPGVIDAYSGGNLQKAISAVETVLGLPADGVLDKAVWDALGGDAAPPVLVQYAITVEDAAYPFLASIPTDFAEQSKLPSLGYTSPEEMFGERFHMDTKLLTALNPNADFRHAGTTIWVTAVKASPITATIARIVADKTLKQVRAYDAANHLIVAYPATIGSEENPSPSGDHLVKSVAPNPIYYYDPTNFVQGGNTEKLQLPPGPNNPVGTVWIDLTEPSYGIHGTPEPSMIGKAASHGCVRLTNWDAEELASLVAPGVVVSFTQ